MKLLLAADLHGSLSATERLLEQGERLQVDQWLLLGDLLNHGPRNPIPAAYAPAAVAACLNPYAAQIMAVQGNCDSEVDQMLLDFPLLGRYSQVLGRFGSKLRRLFLTHGHHYGPDNLPPLAEGDLLASGHTHIPGIAQRCGHWLLNPGSVTLPKGGSVASFALIDEAALSLFALEDGRLLQRQDWD